MDTSPLANYVMHPFWNEVVKVIDFCVSFLSSFLQNDRVLLNLQYTDVLVPIASFPIYLCNVAGLYEGTCLVQFLLIS